MKTIRKIEYIMYREWCTISTHALNYTSHVKSTSLLPKSFEGSYCVPWPALAAAAVVAFLRRSAGPTDLSSTTPGSWTGTAGSWLLSRWSWRTVAPSRKVPFFNGSRPVRTFRKVLLPALSDDHWQKLKKMHPLISIGRWRMKIFKQLQHHQLFIKKETNN